MQILAILGAGHHGQTQIESECLIANLQMHECKAGCLNCSGKELVTRLAFLRDRRFFEHGKCDAVSIKY